MGSTRTYDQQLPVDRAGEIVACAGSRTTCTAAASAKSSGARWRSWPFASCLPHKDLDGAAEVVGQVEVRSKRMVERSIDTLTLFHLTFQKYWSSTTS